MDRDKKPVEWSGGLDKNMNEWIIQRTKNCDHIVVEGHRIAHSCYYNMFRWFAKIKIKAKLCHWRPQVTDHSSSYIFAYNTPAVETFLKFLMRLDFLSIIYMENNYNKN